MMTEDMLYDSFLRGDITAYDQLMIRLGDPLVLYLNGYLHDWQEAEDLMIEAFARIMAKKPSIKAGSFKAYLFRTGRNLALRFYERKRRIRMFSMDGMEKDAADSFLLANAGGVQEGETPAGMLAAGERKKTLLTCLDRIEPDLREALWLVYIDDLSYAQAAEVMGIKVKRIDRLLARGKQQMRIELEKEGVTNAYE